MSGHQQGGENGKNRSDGKDNSHSSHGPERIIPPRGDYQTLLSFQKAEVIYDLTFRFAHQHLARGDRTVDQMIQAARSGKKNLLEGSKAALTSKETEIKLTNVARASLEELLDDYEDYLRARDLKIWDKDSKQALYVRQLVSTCNDTRYMAGCCGWHETRPKLHVVRKPGNSWSGWLAVGPNPSK